MRQRSSRLSRYAKTDSEEEHTTPSNADPRRPLTSPRFTDRSLRFQSSSNSTKKNLQTALSDPTHQDSESKYDSGGVERKQPTVRQRRQPIAKQIDVYTQVFSVSLLLNKSHKSFNRELLY